MYVQAAAKCDPEDTIQVPEVAPTAHDPPSANEDDARPNKLQEAVDSLELMLRQRRGGPEPPLPPPAPEVNGSGTALSSPQTGIERGVLPTVTALRPAQITF